MIKKYIARANFEDTGFSYTLSLISGKHKMVILYCLMEFEVVRFNELKRYLKNVSDKTLSYLNSFTSCFSVTAGNSFFICPYTAFLDCSGSFLYSL